MTAAPGAIDAAARGGRPPGMAPIEGGRFRMGSDDYYPEERPSRLVAVARFWMDLHPVTKDRKSTRLNSSH